MSMIELQFPVLGAALPSDHGYALYAALSKAQPAMHDGSATVRIGPVRGTYADKGMLRLETQFSRLRIRLPAEQIPLTLPLAGKTFDVAGHAIRLGVPNVLSLIPAPNLIARMVIIKASSPRSDPGDKRSRDFSRTKRYQEPIEFLGAVRNELERQGIAGIANLPLHEVGPHAGEPRRHVMRIHGKTIVGFTVLVEGLTAEESLKLQEQGLGGRGKMGCGFFVPKRG